MELRKAAEGGNCRERQKGALRRVAEGGAAKEDATLGAMSAGCSHLPGQATGRHELRDRTLLVVKVP